jgi:uncharacterized membrane protein YqiK
MDTLILHSNTLILIAKGWVFFGAALSLAYWLGVFRYIGNNQVGIVEKLWSTRGTRPSGIVSLRGEAGFEAGLLRGGLHFFAPLQYRVHKVPLVTIPQGKIGYVFARDGTVLPPTQTLADNTAASDFQDVRAFLEVGGQKGPQRKILREGTYVIHLAQFVVITEDRIFCLPLESTELEMFRHMAELIEKRQGFDPIIIQGHEDLLGIVTVHDGPSLEADEIIAPTVGTGHNNFQDADGFLKAGGRRGRQLQILVDGTYFINRLFATVELVPKTVVEVGSVGVVVSYTGQAGSDVSGADFKNGELVEKGQRGVWSTPLLPGKYAFNTYAGKVIIVPTTNFILKWLKAESGAHKFDENLAEVSLITKDAFEPSLPLSVVVHIDYRKAPLVIQRFGDIKRLVEQTLDPMVSAYFKNVAQTRTLIQLLQDRSAIQEQSRVEMKERFSRYNLELLEVLIGTPKNAVGSGGSGQIDQILAQLRLRQVAEEQVETYSRQQKAAVQERELREAEARAKQQTQITESELSIQVQTHQGRADLARAEQQAAQIRALAGAEAEKIRILGEGESRKVQAMAAADAERAEKVGVAQAKAIEAQVAAYGGPRIRMTQEVMVRFAEALEKSKVDIVPRILIGGGQVGQPGPGGANGSAVTTGVIESLLAVLLSEKLKGDEPKDPAA